MFQKGGYQPAIHAVSPSTSRVHLNYRLAKSIWKQRVSNSSDVSYLKKYDEPLYTYQSELPSFGEDYGSMYSWWTTCPSGQHKTAFNTSLWNPALAAVETELSISKHKLKKAGVLPLNAKRSMRHLSVIELVLIQQLLQGSKVEEIIFNPQQLNTSSIQYQMAIKFKKNNTKDLDLLYDQRKLKLEIYSEDKNVCAELKYVTRKGCLEEIIGESFGQSILMDPIWESNKRVRVDNLKIGNLFFRWQLRETKGKKLLATCQRHEIELLFQGIERYKKKFFCIDKKMRINSDSFKIRHLYSSHCLVPLLAVVQKVKEF